MENSPKIGIVGAGFSGLCMAIKLKTELNLDTFTVFESCEEVGGTWFVNTYPGCACDIPSHFYSFSFAPKYDWSRSFSPQPEILEYTKDVTRKFGIYPHIRFQTRVETLRWDEKNLKWRATVLDVKKQRVESHDFDIIINGTGKIRIPHYPEEYRDFKGPLIHSAEWDNSVDLNGKQVGIVGTGASAVQIITTIADKVEHLTIFQRKAPFIMPRPQLEYSETANWAFQTLPGLFKLSRYSIFWFLETIYKMTHHNSLMNKTANQFATWYRNSQLTDPELRKKATPNYTFACKRVILSENYYTTLTRPNVELITERITKVGGSMLTTSDGKDIELDVLILATGYQPHDFFSPMRVYGQGGVDVLEEWKKDRPKGYMGISSHDMPNFYTLLGPYSALGHSSNMYTIECQVEWTIKAIKTMMEKGAKCMTVTKETETGFMKFIDEKLGHTVWGNDDCGSWYLDAKGQNTTLWPDHNVAYWNWCRTVDENMFEFK